MSDLNHGFTIKETRFVKEINANVNIYQHLRTGARLMHIDAADDNKVFTIGFRTPPENNTGVAHIMEHSVLCGSKKFPTKEPFVELLKGSLYTFLNAMTASDFTLYPVASMNDKDFKILLEVYLDAVFFPNLKNIDEIFYQEGWHYEMNDKDDDLNIKGVVYNEMKGAYSSPVRILMQKLSETVFPDTVYKYCSGGIPEHIPELSLEEFRDFHKKYYHPSNSYIYLYGKMDINEILRLINNEALKKFTTLEINSSVSLQDLFKKPIVANCLYAISENENENEKTWFALNFLLDLQNNPALIFSFEVISHLLLDTPAAPLKNAFLRAGIGKDIFGGFDSQGKQPTFSVVLKDSDPIHKETFIKIFFDTLKELCEKGIDKQLIEASINIKEFNLREADMGGYPKGLMYIFSSLNDWVHDKDPINSLCYEDVLEEAKTSLKSSYFEALIKKFLIDNSHYGFVTMNPEKGLAEKSHNEQRMKLAEIKKQLSEVEIDSIVANTKHLLERQNSSDLKEDLEKIPMLEISDVNPKAEDFSLKVNDLDIIKILEHDVFTNGIVYLKLYFENLSIPQDLLPYTRLLTYVLGSVNTKKYHYSELSNLINIHTGGFDFDFDVFSNYVDEDIYRSFFIINSKALMPKTDMMVDLLKEITQNTIYDDVNRLKELLNEFKSRIEMSLMQNGHSFASKRLSAYISESGKFNETISGVEFYFFIKKLLEDFDNCKSDIIEKFKKIHKLIFNKNNLFVSITSPDQDIKIVKNKLQGWIDILEVGKNEKVSYSFKFVNDNEAFILPGKVQYVAKGFSFKKLGFEYSGSMEVMAMINRLDYLWNKIRVQGGAYGAMFEMSPSGMIIANSYRDPNLIESIQVYDKLFEYLKSVEIDDREMTKYILGAIRKYDQPKTASLKSFYSDFYYFIGKSKNSIQRQRDEVLNADLSKIKEYSELLQKLMGKNKFCVFGSEAKIKENKELFNNIINVFE